MQSSSQILPAPLLRGAIDLRQQRCDPLTKQRDGHTSNLLAHVRPAPIPPGRVPPLHRKQPPSFRHHRPRHRRPQPRHRRPPTPGFCGREDDIIQIEYYNAVPGDIITDLQRAGVVSDPYYNTNWREPSFVQAWNGSTNGTGGVWVYSKQFATPPTPLRAQKQQVQAAGGGGRLVLVLDGIRMGSMVYLNGVFL